MNEFLVKLIANGGPGSGNFNPGQGRGIGKPGSGRKSSASTSSKKTISKEGFNNLKKVLSEHIKKYEHEIENAKRQKEKLLKNLEKVQREDEEMKKLADSDDRAKTTYEISHKLSKETQKEYKLYIAQEEKLINDYEKHIKDLREAIDKAKGSVE